MNRKILLIDGLNQFFRSFCVIGITNDNGEFYGGVFGTLQTIKLLVSQFQPNIVIWCWEGRNSGKKRREIYENYKAGRRVRKSLTKAFEFSSIEEEKENMKNQLLKVKQYFETLPIYQLEIDNLEADDVIAYICNNMFKNDQKIIVSSDKDYWQLVNDSVSVYRPVKKELISTNNVFEISGVYPKNFALYKAIIGDTSDEVPKLKKGLGGKTLVKYFPFLSENNIYTIQDIIDFSEKNKENEKYSFFLLNENIEIMKRNYELVQLKENSIDYQSINKIRETFLFQKPILSTSQLMILFLKDSLHSQIKNYDSWHKIFLRLNHNFNPIDSEKDIL